MKSGKLMCIQSIIFVVLVAALAMQVGLTTHGQSGTTESYRLSLESRAGAFLSLANLPGSFHQLAKLTASDGAATDQLGYSVAVSGDTVVAATPYGGEICGFRCRKPASNLLVKLTAGWKNETETNRVPTDCRVIRARTRNVRSRCTPHSFA